MVAQVNEAGDVTTAHWRQAWSGFGRSDPPANLFSNWHVQNEVTGEENTIRTQGDKDGGVVASYTGTRTPDTEHI
jgi:hypothetical protein